MQGRIKIQALIADRRYPMTIPAEEEPAVRQAVQDIGIAVKEIELNYAVRDKQDALSMCLLQYASKMEVERVNKQKEAETLQDSLADIIRMIDEVYEN